MPLGTSSHDLRPPLLALTLLLSAACGSAGGGSDGEAQEESNSAPYLPTQEIQPSQPGTDDTLTVTGSASDADGDPIVQTQQWYVNGALVASSDSLPGSAFSKGDRIHVIVTASDGKDEATRSSDTVTIAN